MADISGRHATANAPTAPASNSAATALPIMRDFVIHPLAFLAF